jgi:hypothetical protein
MVQWGGGQVLCALGRIEGSRARQDSDSDVPGGEAAGDIQKEARADMDKSAIRE